MEKIIFKPQEGSSPSRELVEAFASAGGVSLNKGELGQKLVMTRELLEPQRNVPNGVPPMWRAIQIASSHKEAGLPQNEPIVFRTYVCVKAGNPQRVNGTLVGDRAKYLPLYNEDCVLVGSLKSGMKFKAVAENGSEIDVIIP